MKSIPIANFETRYRVCESGEIINLANNTPLKPMKQPNGYMHVGLAKGNGEQHRVTVHSIVALHFLPNPYGYKQVNHKDGNKSNNHVSNLEWCSSQQNIHHAFITGLRPGYMSADDKEALLHRVLNGEQVKDLAEEQNRRPETLHKMLRDTAKRLGIHDRWVLQMRENRKNVAIRNLSKINS